MAWLAYIKTLRGVQEAQIWHDLDTGGPYYRDVEPRGVAWERFIEKHKLKNGEESLTIDELVKLYPCTRRIG
jgi:hypothetical protein